MNKILYIILWIVCLNSRLCAAQWDVEYWQYLHWNMYEGCRVHLYTLGEFRLNKYAAHLYYGKISECLSYQPHSNLQLEAHYSYIQSKNRGSAHFTNKNRLEFEINPSLTTDCGLTIAWRNRLDLIKKQGISKVQSVFRHRLLLQYEPNLDWPSLSLHSSDEVYYDLNTHKFTQNRFIPIAVQMELNTKLTLDIFLMVRNFYTSNHWYRSFLLGTELSF